MLPNLFKKPCNFDFIDTLINIIHPYTFKLDPKSKSFVMGPMNEYRKRDQELSAFLEESLNQGARVLHHRSERRTGFKGVMHDMAFEVDPYFSLLLDARLDTVITTPYGMPIRNARPSKVPIEEWEFVRNEFSSDAEMAQKVGNPNLTIFIGGIFENCISNAINYHKENYSSHGGRITFIPTLCVSLDQERKKALEERLAGQGIFPITTEKAISLLGN